MDIPIIEQIKIQAQILIPFIKAMQAELGEAKANTLVRNALGEHYQKLGRDFWRSASDRDVGKKMARAFEGFAASDALDYEVVRKTSDAFEVNVTGCRYAQFYQELGLPELGFLLVCSADFALARGYAAGVDLQRTQTIMQGASHCDFKYRLTPKIDGGGDTSTSPSSPLTNGR